MMKTSHLIALTMAILVVGCAPESGEPIDLDAERLAILEADRAWSETPPDVEAFVSVFADGGRLLPPEAPEAHSREDIQKTASGLFSLPGFSVNWSPDFAAVSQAGDLGYSIGTFELTVDDAEGNPVTRNGKYTTVWRKQEDGQWKVVSDTFNFNSPIPTSEE
jgi:ketosteroid isomerase-like protein